MGTFDNYTCYFINRELLKITFALPAITAIMNTNKRGVLIGKMLCWTR